MPDENQTLAQLRQDNAKLLDEITQLKAQLEDSQTLRTTLEAREREIEALMGVPPHPVIARFDRNLRHIYVNSAVKLASGIAPEAYIGKTSREMGLPDKILPLWEGALREVFTKGNEKTIEYSVTVSGTKWTFQSRILPEIDHFNNISSVMAITRDISRQKRAELAILENYEILETVHQVGQALSGELDLQKLVQTVTDVSAQVTGADYCAFVNNQMDAQGKYEIAAMAKVPKAIFAHFPIARSNAVFATTLHDGEINFLDDVRQDPRYSEKLPIYAMPDGYRPTRSLLALPVVSQSAGILGGIFLGHADVGMFTERHKRIVEGLAAQTAIAIDNARLLDEARNQEEQLRITLASIGDAVIATDEKGCVTFMNPVAQSLTGWTDAEARGESLDSVFRIINEVTREAVESPVAKVMREGKVVGLANHTLLITKDGREIPIDDSGAPIYDTDNRLIGVILVFRDISERKLNEQRINLLLELTSAFSQALTMNEIAEVVVERALKALGGLLGTVALLVDDGKQLELLNLRGLSPETAEKYRRTALDFRGPLNDAVRANQIIWIESYEQYVQLYPHFTEAIQRNGSRSAVCLPLQVSGRTIGGFNLSFAVEKPRDADEEAFFVALAHQCAQSLERARLYEFELGRR